MANENKVQFNLKNVHFAPLTEGAEGPSWATPIKNPGAVNLALSQQGEVTPFYADGTIFYQATSNNGYSGDLEVARFVDAVMTGIWKHVKGSTSGLLTEHADVEPSAFALLFQIDGDQTDSLYCMFNCTGTRPDITSKTNESTKTPGTNKSTISCVPLSDGIVFTRTTKDTPDSLKKTWFTNVGATYTAAQEAAAGAGQGAG